MGIRRASESYQFYKLYSTNQVFYNLLIFTSTGPFSVIKVAFRGSDVGLIVCIGDDGTVVLCNKVVWQFCERSLSFEFTSLDMLEVLKRLVGTMCHFGTSFTSVLPDDVDSILSGFLGFINLNLDLDVLVPFL